MDPRLALELGAAAVPVTGLAGYAAWRGVIAGLSQVPYLMPRRATEVLTELWPQKQRSQPRLRRVWRRRHTWHLAWKMPIGATVSGWSQNQEAIEQALNSSVRVWFDDQSGLVRARLGVKRLPRLIEYEDFYSGRRPNGELVVGIGDGKEGPVWLDLARAYNFLLGGAIGGGKSTILNAIIVQLAEAYSPQEVQLVLMDLKGGNGIEFGMYERLPHLWRPVVTELEECPDVFLDLLAEVRARYALMKPFGKKIEHYNNPAMGRRLPRLVVVIDEFAELQGLAKQLLGPGQPVESLTRTARAAGVHFIVATQRPDVNVMPGQIRNNFKATLAFYCGDVHSSGVLLEPGDGRAHALDADDPGLGIWQYRTSTKVRAINLTNDEAERRVRLLRSLPVTEPLSSSERGGGKGGELLEGSDQPALPFPADDEPRPLSGLVHNLLARVSGTRLPVTSRVSSHWQEEGRL